MGLLAKATAGVIKGPKVSVIYGINKIGKTTFVCSAPKHVLLDLEKGSNDIGSANRIQLDWTVELVKETLNELLTTNHGYKTVGIDSIEALESLISKELCASENVDSIEQVGGGFGKGFMRTREVMREIMHLCLKLKEKGMDVWIIGHSQTKTLTDPMTDLQYDQHIMRTNDKMASIVKDLADNIFFVGREISEAKKKGETVIVSDNAPYMFTQWRKAFVAGNRSNLPFKIPLDYPTYVHALELGASKEQSLEELRAETQGLVEGLDKDTRPKAEESLKAAKTKEEIIAIKNRVNQIIST